MRAHDRTGGNMSDLGKLLRPGESVRMSGGVSSKALLVDALYLTSLVAVFVVIAKFLSSLGGGSATDVFGSFVRLLYAVMGAFLALTAAFVILSICMRALFTTYALTDSRVLRRTFLRSRAAELAHVQDLEVVQNLAGRMLGYGDVLVRTASSDGLIVFRRVDRPHDWFRSIHEAVRLGQMDATRLG